MKTLSPSLLLGMHISECVNILVNTANEHNDQCSCVFNEVTLTANPGDKALTLQNYFHAEIEKQRLAYEASPEYAAKQIKDAEEVAAMQTQVNELVDQFQTMDLHDLAPLLHWIAQLQPLSDRTGVKVPELVTKKLEAAGYVGSMNTGSNYKADDKLNAAQYLVGQAISGLQEVGAIHSIVVRFTKQWMEKFN